MKTRKDKKARTIKVYRSRDSNTIVTFCITLRLGVVRANVFCRVLFTVGQQQFFVFFFFFKVGRACLKVRRIRVSSLCARAVRLALPTTIKLCNLRRFFPRPFHTIARDKQLHRCDFEEQEVLSPPGQSEVPS